MAYTFNINKVFEENLEMDFLFSGQNFTTDGQVLIIQTPVAVQNVKTLTSWSYTVSDGLDTDNTFTIEYRYSFDTVNYTSWVTMPPFDDFNNFLDPNTAPNVWFQIRYTYNSTLSTPNVVELKEINIYGTRKVDEIFQPITLVDDKPVVYTNQDTYKVFKMTDYTVFIQNNGSQPSGLLINFRYTQNQGRTWSKWMKLSAENLVSTQFDPIRFVNFQFSFQNNTGSSISIWDLELIGEFQNVTANYATTARLGLKTQCNPLLNTPPPTGPCDDNCANQDQFTVNSCGGTCTPCSQAVTPWATGECSPCSDDKLFKLNKNYGALPQLYSYLNSALSTTNGWTVKYALTDPDKKGIDVILHEIQLANVIAVKDMQIVIPDNQIPTTDISFSGLDLDLIQSFEIHIEKTKFKDAFGVEFRPSKKDILYLCEFNQLWEVEMMFPNRGPFAVESYYRVLLKKYNDRSSRQFVNNADKQFIDALTKHTTLDDLFGIQTDNELKKGSKNINVNLPDASQQLNSMTQLNIRSSLTGTIVPFKLWNSSVTVAESYYDLPIQSAGLRLIEYVNTDRELGIADDRAISFWFNTSDYDPSWRFDLINNYKVSSQDGYRLYMTNNSMCFDFNNQTYTLPMIGFAVDTWYCVLVNLDQKQSKLELAMYRRHVEDGEANYDSKLVQFHKMIWDITPQSFSTNETIYIGGVDRFNNNTSGNRNTFKITNLRIYNQIMEKSKRNIVLNQRVVTDSHLLILNDNAEKSPQMSDYGNI